MGGLFDISFKKRKLNIAPRFPENLEHNVGNKRNTIIGVNISRYATAAITSKDRSVAFFVHPPALFITPQRQLGLNILITNHLSRRPCFNCFKTSITTENPLGDEKTNSELTLSFIHDVIL